MKILCPISLGEFADKISVLKVKLSRIKDEAKQANINLELSELISIQKIPGLNDYIDKLIEINGDLFDVLAEQRTIDPDKFIHCAKKVIILNDKRFSIKNEINKFFKSDINEEKYYEKWDIPV